MLTMMDMLTGYPFAFPIPDKTAETVVSTILEHYIPDKWCPKTFLSDNGTEFKNEQMKFVCDALDIERKFSSPHYPQSNGKLERFHSFLKSNLTKMCTHDKINWDKYVSAVVATYRVTPHTSSGDTPYFLVHGYDPPMPITKLLQPHLRYVGDDQGRLQLDKFYQAIGSARYNLVEARSKQGFYKSRKVTRNNPTYHIGDRVMVRNHNKSSLDDKWLTGYRIIDISPNGRGFTLQEQNYKSNSRNRRANITDIAPDPYSNTWLNVQPAFGRPAKYINHPTNVIDKSITAEQPPDGSDDTEENTAGTIADPAPEADIPQPVATHLIPIPEELTKLPESISDKDNNIKNTTTHIGIRPAIPTNFTTPNTALAACVTLAPVEQDLIQL